MQSLRNHRRFVHTSFRISEDLRSELGREAERQGINLNALANRVLTEYITFDRIIEHNRSVVLDREVFAQVIDGMLRDDLEKMGMKLGPKLAKRTFEFFDIEPTVENLISRYFGPMGAYSGMYQSNIITTGSVSRLILEHKFGYKWSAFLAEYVKGIVKSILGVEPRIESSDDLIRIEFRRL